MSTLQVDRIEPYQSASVTIVGLDIDTTALNNFTASQEVINSNLEAFTASQETLNSGYATTGSNSFVGNQVVSGDITATRLTLTGGAGNDLIVTGALQTSQGIFPNGGVLTGAVGGLRTFAGDYGFYNGSGSNDNVIGITIDNVGYGNTGWDGPALWSNDPTNSYPALIGFQKKDNWTDGTVSILKPLAVTGSVSITGVTAINDDLKQNIGVSGNAAIFQNPNYFSEYYGTTLLWRPTFNGGLSKLALNEKAVATIQINAWSSSYDEVLDITANSSGVIFADWTLPSYTPSTWLTIPQGQAPVFNRGVNVSTVMNLAAQDPLPSGNVGDLAVSGSNLYFYTDQWREVAFV